MPVAAVPVVSVIAVSFRVHHGEIIRGRPAPAAYNGWVQTPVEVIHLLDTLEAARAAVDVGSDRQASDIVLLDVAGVCGFADYLVIMSADNPRQIDALAEELEYALERQDHALHHREGRTDSGWVLLDFGNVIVHVFSEDQRDHYRLDQLWSSGKQLVRIQ